MLLLQFVPDPEPDRTNHIERRAWVDAQGKRLSKLIPGTVENRDRAIEIYREVRVQSVRASHC